VFGAFKPQNLIKASKAFSGETTLRKIAQPFHRQRKPVMAVQLPLECSVDWRRNYRWYRCHYTALWAIEGAVRPQT
jgi:hypothetical protein